jgi:hypothetical protein
MNYRILFLAPLAAAVLSVGAASPLRMPSGWFGFQMTSPADFSLMPKAASEGFEIGIDRASDASGLPSLTIRSVVAQQPDPISLGAAQQVLVGYGGKRVRFSAQLRAQAVRGWSGLFLGPGNGALLSQFPMARPGIEAELPAGAAATADGDWHEASVVVDVPADTAEITFGLLLAGEGQVWARNLQFQVVGPEVAPTRATVQLKLQSARQHWAQAKASLAKLPIPPAPLANAALD